MDIVFNDCVYSPGCLLSKSAGWTLVNSDCFIIMGEIQDGRQRPFGKQINIKSDNHNLMIFISDQYWGVVPIPGLKMVNLGFKASHFHTKKLNSLLKANIMHIAHFLNLYGADMRFISCGR